MSVSLKPGTRVRVTCEHPEDQEAIPDGSVFTIKCDNLTGGAFRDHYRLEEITGLFAPSELEPI